MGHGFVVPHFQPIRDLPPNCNLKFYVPEGLLREDFDRTYKGKEEEKETAFEELKHLSLYNGQCTAYYIWNNGEPIGEIDGIPQNVKDLEIGVNFAVLPLHEHLLLNLPCKIMRDDLAKGTEPLTGDSHGVIIEQLKALKTFDGVPIKVFLVQNVILEGVDDKKRENEYIITPSWPSWTFPKDAVSTTNNTAYKLSWLIKKIVELKDELSIPDEEEIHICWLACRFAMEGTDAADFFTKYKYVDGDTSKIERIYPPDEP